MSLKQIKIWYVVLIGELILVGILFLVTSFGAELLGIYIGGDWGIIRTSIAGLGFIVTIMGLFLLLLGIKKMPQAYKIASFSRWVTESAVWIFVAIGICELILRTTIANNPEITYEKDWGIVPVAGSPRFLGKEGYGITHYLAHGEIVTPFDDGVISVVVLGDSHTEALQVSECDKFVTIAETKIRSKGRPVNLHNLGSLGSSIPDYIYLAPMIRQYYNPKTIVIQLSPQDFWWGEGDGFNVKHRNYFVLNNGGDLELVHSNLVLIPGVYTNFTQRIMTYSLGRERYLQIIEKINEKSNSIDQLSPVHTRNKPILPKARLAEQLKLLKNAYSGINIILISLPLAPNIEGDGLNYIDAENIEILNSAKNIGGFFIVDPQAEFNNIVARGHLPRGFRNSLPGIGHLNILANRIVGELLAEKILEITK